MKIVLRVVELAGRVQGVGAVGRAVAESTRSAFAWFYAVDGLVAAARALEDVEELLALRLRELRTSSFAVPNVVLASRGPCARRGSP